MVRLDLLSFCDYEFRLFIYFFLNKKRTIEASAKRGGWGWTRSSGRGFLAHNEETDTDKKIPQRKKGKMTTIDKTTDQNNTTSVF